MKPGRSECAGVGQMKRGVRREETSGVGKSPGWVPPRRTSPWDPFGSLSLVPCPQSVLSNPLTRGQPR